MFYLQNLNNQEFLKVKLVKDSTKEIITDTYYQPASSLSTIKPNSDTYIIRLPISQKYKDMCAGMNSGITSPLPFLLNLKVQDNGIERPLMISTFSNYSTSLVNSFTDLKTVSVNVVTKGSMGVAVDYYDFVIQNKTNESTVINLMFPFRAMMYISTIWLNYYSTIEMNDQTEALTEQIKTATDQSLIDSLNKQLQDVQIKYSTLMQYNSIDPKRMDGVSIVLDPTTIKTDTSTNINSSSNNSLSNNPPPSISTGF